MWPLLLLPLSVGSTFCPFWAFWWADCKSKLLIFELFYVNYSVFRRLGSCPGDFRSKNVLLIVLRVKKGFLKEHIHSP